MNIDINNEHHKSIWRVLKTISENIPINLEGKKNNQDFNYPIDVNIYTNKINKTDDQYQILNILKKEGVITETKIKDDTFLIKDSINPIKDQAFVIYHFKTTNKFEDFYKKFKQIFNNTKQNQTNNVLTFYEDGNIIFVSPEGKEYKTKLGIKTNSYVLLKILIEKPHHVFSFLDLAKYSKTTVEFLNEERKVRDAIKAIRDKLKYYDKNLFITDNGFGLKCNINLR
ncbi:MAG: hypothetical protein WC895_04040 [Candidatus Shapirobacteria bacterium]|jgi:hypothetical protein